MMRDKKSQLTQVYRIVVFCILTLFLIPPLVEGASEANRVVLGPYYGVFEDSTNKVSIEDLIGGKYDQYFTPSTQRYPFFWHTTDTIWLRLSFHELMQGNPSGYVIEGIDKQDKVHVYFVKKDGTYTFQEGGISGLDSQPVQ